MDRDSERFAQVVPSDKSDWSMMVFFGRLAKIDRLKKNRAALAVRWGFSGAKVGLTGSRRNHEVGERDGLHEPWLVFMAPWST